MTSEPIESLVYCAFILLNSDCRGDALKDTLNKNDWLTAEDCLAMAWFALRGAPTAPSEAGRFRMEQGQEVGALARQRYPDGVLVAGKDGKTPAEVTQELIANQLVGTLFEAAFSSGPFVAKADILRREGAGWHVLEVKSNFSDARDLSDLVDDLAYTVMVARRAGLQVAKASLALLSRSYVYGQGVDRLFEIIEKTSEVSGRVAEFDGNADGVVRALFGDVRPAATLTSACRDCDFFDGQCLGAGIAHTVFEIPSLHYKKLNRLSAAGIIDLSLIPNDLGLNDKQERAKAGALTGKTMVDSGLKATLASIQWPCYYLDFETVMLALPLYPGHGCHRPVLTQFSVHSRDGLGADLCHGEYLADATADCERELAEALIEALGDHGTIFMYSSYEATRIKVLRASFPDLSAPLDSILARLTDLLRIVQDNVYQPAFKGSFSIKSVLPALVSDVSYKGLDIANGDTAITRFARMARGEIIGDAVAITRQQLLEYCKTDTLAMVGA